MWIMMLTVLLSASLAMAAIKAEVVPYEVDGAKFQGYLAYDDALSGKSPGVVIFPEWWGNNDYAQGRARMLAELGYVAFVADMYGEGKVTTDPKEAQSLSKSIYSDPAKLIRRADGALSALKQSGKADNNRLGAIGYCMGGTVALNLARSGADIQAVVGFHCGLSNLLKESALLKAKVLVCNGADDKSIKPEEQQAFVEEMRQAKADWQYVIYGGAVHAFTNPAADLHKDLGIGYNANADRRSWQLMEQFLAEALRITPPGAAERGISPLYK